MHLAASTRETLPYSFDETPEKKDGSIGNNERSPSRPRSFQLGLRSYPAWHASRFVVSIIHFNTTVPRFDNCMARLNAVSLSGAAKGSLRNNRIAVNNNRGFV